MAIKVADVTDAPLMPSYEGHDSLVLPKCMIGIEIEVENIRTWPKLLTGTWRQTDEGSLRNHGREFITAPIFGKDLVAAIELFHRAMKGYTPEYTRRTSVHVHMDFRDATFVEVENTVSLMTILERTLFRWVGKGRDKNIYCIPLHQSHTAMKDVAAALFHAKDKNNTRKHINNWCKYSSLNLLPLLHYGSIEFRHHYGTGNASRILQWVNLLMCLKRAAQLYPDMNWITFISVTGVDEFISTIFKDHADVIRPFVTDSDIYLGLRTLQDLKEAYTLIEGQYSVYKCHADESAYVKYKHKGVQS